MLSTHPYCPLLPDNALPNICTECSQNCPKAYKSTRNPHCFRFNGNKAAIRETPLLANQSNSSPMFASTENHSEPLPLFLETALTGIPPHPAENISPESLLYNQTECTEKAIYSELAEKFYRFVPSC